MKTKTFAIFAFLLCLSLVSAHECGYNRKKVTPRKNPPSSTNSGGRRLQEYEKIRIHMDYSWILDDEDASEEAKTYLTEVIMPAAEAYFEAELSVIPVDGNLVIEGGDGCFYDIPEEYTTDGVEADLIIYVTGVDKPDEDWLAGASACVLDGDNNRPIYGEIDWNYATLNTDSEFKAENDILTGLHELIHVFGFADNLYEFYWNNDEDAVQTGNTDTVTHNEQEYTYLNVEPLTTKLRDHFDCNTIEGAILENNGNQGSAGSHFERRTFHAEFMTANDIVDARISEFTLALLEGTGWYEVDYDMADPFTWGKDQGCGFWEGPCLEAGANPTTDYGDFYCTDITANACTYTGTAQGYCGTTQITTDNSLDDALDYFQDGSLVGDGYSDNCPRVTGYSNGLCENPDDADIAKLDDEVFDLGSRCFTGTLRSGSAFDETQTYCFQQECNNAGTEVEITIGDVTVTCTEAGTQTVDGYSGEIDCPDPAAFCDNQGLKYCKRGCLGQGSCVDDECDCDSGFTGVDCLWPTDIYDEIFGSDGNGGEEEEEEEDSEASNWSPSLQVCYLAMTALGAWLMI